MSPARYIDNVQVGEYKTWPFPDESYSFDSSLSPSYTGRFTTCFKLDNGLLARILVGKGPFKLRGNGWRNERDEGNLKILVNAYDNAKKLQGLSDWRINIPDPIGLFLVKSKNFDNLHPAFVMEYKQNDSFNLPEEKKREVLKIRDDMIEAAKEYGFIPGLSAKHLDNFIYNKADNKVYLVGLGTWEKK